MKCGNFKYKKFNLGEYVEFEGKIRKILAFDINDGSVGLKFKGGCTISTSSFVTYTKNKYKNL